MSDIVLTGERHVLELIATGRPFTAVLSSPSSSIAIPREIKGGRLLIGDDRRVDPDPVEVPDRSAAASRVHDQPEHLRARRE